MELTIEQALQRGVAAHKEGKLQEAERLYRKILQSQPTHPDANHNLGVLAVSANKADAALPLFKTAVEANPRIEQFWLSYIDALIKEKQFESARQILHQGKQLGVAGEKLNPLEAQLASRKNPENVKSASPSQLQHNALLEHYQNRKYSDAEKLAISITQEFPSYQLGWKVLGAVYGQVGRNSEAVDANQTAVALSPEDAAAHSNLGVALQELGRLEEAEASHTQAIALKPNFAEAHNNLGSTLQEQGKLDEAEASCRQAIALKSDYAEAHYNLGNMLKELGRLDESEASCNQAIALKPDLADAHYNLGITLQELGRLDEAEASYPQAIALKPDHAEAHSNLGITLQELGRLEEAKASYRHAIALKPDLALAHINLGRLLYNMGYKNLALESIEKANHLDPQSKESRLILSVIKSRRSREESEAVIGDASKVSAFRGLTSIPLILNRVVEAELISYIYGMSSKTLDKTKDARYGNGTCSPDFSLFEDPSSIIRKVAEDLTSIIMEAVKSEIYISESFFNIVGAGGGINIHDHISDLDKDIGLNLGKHKYALQYYLSVGDQNCSEPGVLKLYEPVEDILPCEGMITIIPASRMHSAGYGGKTDRVMIGVNFYSL